MRILKKYYQQKYILYITILLIILFCNISANSHSRNTSITNRKSFNTSFYDEFSSKSNYFIFPYDEWGTRGSYSLFGLPAYGSNFTYNGFSLRDPLFGKIPSVWIKTRFTSLDVSDDMLYCNLQPLFVKGDKTISRFDYYKGDYGFKNFGIILSSNFSEKTRWSLYAENFGYDGWMGLYGPQISMSGENIAQTFNLDINTNLEKWIFDMGTSYQKYRSSMIQASCAGFSGEYEFLQWNSNGTFKEHRYNSYFQAHKKSSADSTIIGAQLSGYYFRNNSTYFYNGESSSLDWHYVKYFSFFNKKFIFTVSDLSEKVFITNREKNEQNLLNFDVRNSGDIKIFSYDIDIALKNREICGSVRFDKHFSEKINFALSTQKEYALYPLIYSIPVEYNDSVSFDREGFSYFITSASVDYESANITSSFGINSVQSNFMIPFKNHISDSTFQYIEQDHNALYLTENFSVQFPWRMDLHTRIIFSPTINIEKNQQLQIWARLTQKLNLFQGNLRLYASGDLLYQRGGTSLAWFEELRDFGVSGVSYFNNEKLSFVTRVGGHVGSFHLFYAIFNVQGRQFSSIPSMPYFSRLKVLGVEWSFWE